MTQSPGCGHPRELGQSGCVRHLLPGGDLGFSLERQLSPHEGAAVGEAPFLPFPGGEKGKGTEADPHPPGPRHASPPPLGISVLALEAPRSLTGGGIHLPLSEPCSRVEKSPP